MERDEGLVTVILARVAVGDPFFATETMRCRRPPERGGQFEPGLLFDAVVANPGMIPQAPGGTQHHQEVVLFDGERAYPELIVRFGLPELTD